MDKIWAWILSKSCWNNVHHIITQVADRAIGLSSDFYSWWRVSWPWGFLLLAKIVYCLRNVTTLGPEAKPRTTLGRGFRSEATMKQARKQGKATCLTSPTSPFHDGIDINGWSQTWPQRHHHTVGNKDGDTSSSTSTSRVAILSSPLLHRHTPLMMPRKLFAAFQSANLNGCRQWMSTKFSSSPTARTIMAQCIMGSSTKKFFLAYGLDIWHMGQFNGCGSVLKNNGSQLVLNYGGYGFESMLSTVWDIMDDFNSGGRQMTGWDDLTRTRTTVINGGSSSLVGILCKERRWWCWSRSWWWWWKQSTTPDYNYDKDEYVVRKRCHWFKVLDIEWQRRYNAGDSEVLVPAVPDIDAKTTMVLLGVFVRGRGGRSINK